MKIENFDTIFYWKLSKIHKYEIPKSKGVNLFTICNVCKKSSGNEDYNLIDLHMYN